MKYIYLILWLTIISAGKIYSQHPNVVVGNSQGYGFPSEPTVMMNPLNAQEILVGACQNVSYYSLDGGLSWSEETIQSPFNVVGDPVLLVDTSGRFYYLHLPDPINRVICHRTDHLGSAWTMESNAAYDGIHDVDKEWACYDPVHHVIHLTWTYFDTWGSSSPQDSSCIYHCSSGDGGETWSSPGKVSDKKGNATGGIYSVHGSYNTTGPNGEIYVCWFSPEGLLFDKSTDGGLTWLPNDINTTGALIRWQYSIPGVNLGVTFPYIACDRSNGPGRGNIYITWADRRNGNTDTDVFMVRSVDGGQTWSTPVRINDDPPGKHQFFPAVTVDQVTGKVWIVFFDRRNFPDQNTEVYMAVSEDGGESFINFKVSETPFIPFASVFFGHYIGLTAHNDVVFPVWNRMDEGESTLIGARVNPSIVGLKTMPEKPEAEVISFPNPFLESSFISFKLQKPDEITIRLFDITGKEITTLINQEVFLKGKHVFKLDAKSLNLVPGAYLVSLKTSKGQVTHRVVCIGK